MSSIKVIKRNGKKEPVMLDKILDRITQQTYGLDTKWIIPFEIAQKVIEGITPDIKTSILELSINWIISTMGTSSRVKLETVSLFSSSTFKSDQNSSFRSSLL